MGRGKVRLKYYFVRSPLGIRKKKGGGGGGGILIISIYTHIPMSEIPWKKGGKEGVNSIYIPKREKGGRRAKNKCLLCPVYTSHNS